MKEPHLQLSTSCLPGLAGPPEPSRDPFDQLLSEHTDPLVRSVSSQHLSELPGSAGSSESSGNSVNLDLSVDPDPILRSFSAKHLSELPGSAGPPEPSGNSFYINISSYSSNPLPIGLTP